MERRLTTILSADVVGYSRLMEQDEAGTLEALQSLRKDVIRPKEQQYHGRTVKLMGDGALMEFASVVDAVTFAADVQMILREASQEVPEARRIVFRIGINIGDIIVEDNDIYGDGVNVAARLEGICEPGGICISHNVFDQVRGKLDLTFQPLGEKQVKNISEPVSVYQVVLNDKAAALVTPITTAVAPTKGRRRQVVTIGLALAAVVLAATAGLNLWTLWVPKEEPVSVKEMAFPLPDKPSIAVLPFDNLSDDPGQEYFADGMTEDLITDLSKISGLFVISRNSTFTYKDRAVNVRDVAEELGVRYVLEGSVRRAGEQIRINTQLIDATTGGHVWAERYDHRLENVFAVQDAIVARIVQALELHLTAVEEVGGQSEPETVSLEAYDLVLKARRQLTRFERPATEQAAAQLQEAIDLDPNYAEAYSLLGFLHFDEWRLWGRGRDQNLSRAEDLAEKAASLRPDDPAPHALLAMVHQWRREFDPASEEADRALALEPQDAITLSNIGSVLVYAGRGEEAARMLEQAVRLDPFHPPSYLEWLGNAYWLMGDSERCVEVAQRGVALDPDYVSLHVVLAICHAALGRETEAAAAAEEILRINPGFSLDAYAAYVPYSDPRDRQRRVELLRSAGVPE